MKMPESRYGRSSKDVSAAPAVAARAKTRPFSGDCVREFTLAEYYGSGDWRVGISTEEVRREAASSSGGESKATRRDARARCFRKRLAERPYRGPHRPLWESGDR